MGWLHCNLQVQQKQASDAGITDKLSRLSVADSAVNERDADGRCDNSAGNQSDQPPSKRTKNSSRSRRRRKGHRPDAAVVAVNVGATCEFVRGGGGKVHSSSGGPRRDWFSVDTNSKKSSLDASDNHSSELGFTRDSRERWEGTDRRIGAQRRDGSARKTATPQEASTTRSNKSATSTVAVRSKEPKNQQSVTKVGDATQGSKSAASKELSADKRSSATQNKNNMSSASATDVNGTAKVSSEYSESGWLFCVC